MNWWLIAIGFIVFWLGWIAHKYLEKFKEFIHKDDNNSRKKNM